MPTEIKTEGTKETVVRIDATPDEVEEIFTFTPDKKLIGSEWRLKETTP